MPITAKPLRSLLLLFGLASFGLVPSADAAPPSTTPPSTPAASQTATDWQPFVNGIIELATSELSGALAQAYSTHIQTARPLPDDVKVFLRGIIPDEFIERARFTVSNDSITLPGILNQGNREYMGQDNAMSIDNLIIFSREPTLTAATDARWWSHELGHHIQYKRWGGIPGFARQYVLDYQGVEREAETYGEQGMKKYIDQHH